MDREKVAVLAGERLHRCVERGDEAYRREEMLPRLLPVASTELASPSPRLTRRLCLLLARALRQERIRGRAGHWTYDLNRHLGLLQAYRAERRRLTSEVGAGRVRSGGAETTKGAVLDRALRTERS